MLILGYRARPFGRMLFCKKIGKNFRKVVDFFVERGYNTQNKKEGNLRLREDYGSFISVKSQFDR